MTGGPWVDEVAVDRAVAGQPVGRPLTYHERTLAIERLIRTDLPSADIAARVGLTTHAIKKRREKAKTS